MDTFTTKPGSVTGPYTDLIELSATGPISTDGVVIDARGDIAGTYGNSIAAVLNASRDTAAGLLITDPTASSPGAGGHDTLLIKGITKQQFAQNQADIAFHA